MNVKGSVWYGGLMSRGGNMIKRKINLRTGKSRFGGILFDRKSRQLFIRWFAPTEVSNIIWAFMLVFRLRWPPIRWLNAFINTDIK